MSCDQEMLFELILAANFMDIKPLLDLACAKVASMIKGKTPEDIRKVSAGVVVVVVVRARAQGCTLKPSSLTHSYTALHPPPTCSDLQHQERLHA